MKYDPYTMSAGYRHGMMVREAAAMLAAAVCWLVKLAVVLAVMLLPYLADGLYTYYTR